MRLFSKKRKTICTECGCRFNSELWGAVDCPSCGVKLNVGALGKCYGRWGEV